MVTQTKREGVKRVKKVLYTDFEGIDDIIAKMLDNKDIKKAITRSNLYKFWDKVAGKKFAEMSKPYGMVGLGVMVIACKNAAVAQELTLNRQKLLREFEPYLKSLHFKVTDLKFDCRKWLEE